MKTLANKPQSIVQNILDVFYFYPAIFKLTWPLITITAFLHLVYPWALKFNVYVGLAFVVACILLIWFLFAAIIYRSFYYLKGEAISYEMVWRHARRRFIAILAGNVIFIFILAFASFIELALIQAAEIVHLDKEVIIFSAVLNLFILILIYFAVPLIVLDNSRVFSSFEKSARLVIGNWWRAFLPWVFFVLVLIILNGIAILITGQLRFMLYTAGMFLITLVFYPLIVGYTLTLLNDLKLRQQQKQNGVSN